MTDVDATDLPVIPAARNAHCPLEPPAEFADWREADGLQLAQWRGGPTPERGHHQGQHEDLAGRGHARHIPQDRRP